MKIVTAGHRGIVATGEEIRGARDNKRRLFSYSLVLLLSCVVGGFAANGAKFCQAKAGAYNSYVQNASQWVWASGTGCKYSGQTYDAAAALDANLTESNLSSACSGNSIFGVAACVGSYENNDDLYDNGPDFGGGKGVIASGVMTGVVSCFCQMRGQRTNGIATSARGIWNMKSPVKNLAYCEAHCANLCGRHARSQFPHFLAGVMAVPAP